MNKLENHSAEDELPEFIKKAREIEAEKIKKFLEDE